MKPADQKPAARLSGRQAWRRWLLKGGYAGLGLAGAGAAGYFVLWFMLYIDAQVRLARPPVLKADTALILGNRAYLNGKPNPCLIGRIDAGLALAATGNVRMLTMSGGRDDEDSRIEAKVMEQHARGTGYAGPILLELRSSSTRENLAFSLPLLHAAGIRSVVVVTEPFHLWRAQRLVQASGFGHGLQVQYAAAPTLCWRRWGMAFQGALREPLAIAHNFWRGYY